MAKAMAIIGLAVAMAVGGVKAGVAQQPDIPKFWDPGRQINKPDLSLTPRIRFLTTIDFPPFNFIDQTGHLAGYNVDLARAICSELKVSSICQIEAIPWSDLQDALRNKRGEAIIAGLRPTAELRKQFAFTRSYLRLPARFVVRRDAPLTRPLNLSVSGKRVGVMAGSVHEAILRAYFPAAKVVTYSRRDWMLEDLKEKKTDAVFGDSMSLAFWIGGDEAKGCCSFAGGPYMAPQFLGEGLTIATTRKNEQLVGAFNYALRALEDKGTLADLYLRYFPIGFY